jgi:predicted GNAT superfamily acetyltransferase
LAAATIEPSIRRSVAIAAAAETSRRWETPCEGGWGGAGVSRNGVNVDPAAPTPTPPTAVDLGFAVHDEPRGPHGEPMSWSKRVGEHRIGFRLLRRLAELLPVDDLQREVFGVSDLDLLNAGELVSVSETGGDVIGAFIGSPGGDEELVGFSTGWGGFFRRRPRIVSEYLAVRAGVRSLGLGADLKRLQAAIALERGFVEIVWTVDPLRAANARLNFEKLGAFADRYEENRYGEGFAAGLYGGLPTDRLHVTWPITDPRVHDRLRGRYTPLTTDDVGHLRRFDPGAAGQERALVYLPSDIDLLVARDPKAALRWRLSLRETLQRAFAAGFAITGFVPGVDVEQGSAAYVIEKDPAWAADRGRSRMGQVRSRS